MLFFIIAIVLSVFIESTLIQIPILLSVLLFLTLIYENPASLLIAFLAGVILDILMVRSIGSSSLFFLLYFFLVIQYGRKFEIKSNLSVFIFSLIGGGIYAFIFNYDNFIFQAVVTAVFSVLLYRIIPAKGERNVLT